MSKPVAFLAPLPVIPHPPTKATNGVRKSVQPIIKDLPVIPHPPTKTANGVHQVAQPIIENLPPTAPSSPLSSRSVTPELPDQDDELVVIFSSMKKAATQGIEPTKLPPIDIVWVKKEMELARIASQSDASLAQMYYLRVMQRLNNSALDSRGLLVGVFCSLIIARFMQKHNKCPDVYIDRAALSLELLNRRLWTPNCPEKQNSSFMYLVGTAQLIINQNSTDAAQHRLTKGHFFTVAKLIEGSSPMDPLRQKNLLGQSLASLYEVRRAILKDGLDKRRAYLLETLNQSREFLENSLEILSSNIPQHPSSSTHQYQMALTHCLTTLLLEKQQLEEKTAESDRLYQKSEDHLKKAEAILNAIEVKTGPMRALLGIIKHKNGFDHEKIAYDTGWEGAEDLSEADSLLEGADPLLRLAITDARLQIAWALPVELMRYRAECSLQALAKETGDCKLVAESFQLVFNIQTSLWQLIETNKNLLELQKSGKDRDLGTIKLEDIDITTLVNLAAFRRETLNAFRKQSPTDRLKNAVKDLRLLELFADAAVLDLAKIELIFSCKCINSSAYDEMVKDASQDLKVIEILKKASLKMVRDNAFENLSNSSHHLRKLLEKSKDAPRFAPIWFHLTKSLSKLEKNYLSLTISPENPKEQRTYSALVQKIGNKFDGCYTLALFKEMLVERLKDYDFVIDLELDMI